MADQPKRSDSDIDASNTNETGRKGGAIRRDREALDNAQMSADGGASVNVQRSGGVQRTGPQADENLQDRQGTKWRC